MPRKTAYAGSAPHIRLTSEQTTRIAELIALTGVSQSDMIRRAIDDYLDRELARRASGLGFTPKVIAQSPVGSEPLVGRAMPEPGSAEYDAAMDSTYDPEDGDPVVEYRPSYEGGEKSSADHSPREGDGDAGEQRGPQSAREPTAREWEKVSAMLDSL